MKVHANFLSDSALSKLREEFDAWWATDTFTEQYTIDHEDTIKEIFHLTEKSLIQQKRSVISHTDAGKYIKELLRPVVTIEEDDIIYFSRSFYPIGLHADADYHTATDDSKTFLIPLTFNDKILTMVFKNRMTNHEFTKFSQAFINDPSQFTYKSDLSKQYKVDNCWFGSPNLLDYMELDGAAPWSKGSLIEFDKIQLHSSNNYKEIVEFKDYILVHTK